MIALVLLSACSAHGAGAAFTVATYNVKVAEKSDGEALSWEKRLPRLVKVMRAGKFDLIGLQEVSRNMEVDFAAALPEYAFVDGPKKDGPVPIAYRPKLFELLESGRFSMSEKPDDFKFVSWGASCVRVCQWALFRVRADGSRIRVFNMHPDWKSCKARAKGMEMSGIVIGSSLMADLRKLIRSAQSRAAVSLNAEAVMLYWSIGSRIKVDLMKNHRAGYGERVQKTVSEKLTAEFGSGWGLRKIGSSCMTVGVRTLHNLI